MSNYELKQTAILGNLHIQERQLRYAIYRALGCGDESALDNFGNQYHDNHKKYGELWHSAYLVNQSASKRIQRIKRRIAKSIMSGTALFLTLTFTNDTLNQTTEQTRRKYVSRFLKENSSNYLANIDYGSINNREHYHAILSGELVNLSQWHKYGAINMKHIGKSTKDLTKISKYVAKLTNHAIKETTKAPRLIYSRKHYQP